jgi:hypothetical protein
LPICRPAISIEEKDVEFGDQLGSGGFSVVYRGTWLGTPVAIKQWFDSNASSEKRREIREEVLTLAVMSCVSLVMLYTKLALHHWQQCTAVNARNLVIHPSLAKEWISFNLMAPL